MSTTFTAGRDLLGSALAPLAPWLERTTILRGLEAEALNHPQAIAGLVSGHLQEPGPRGEKPSFG